MSEFAVIEVQSNWGYWDTLNGVPVSHGELLEIELPDGTRSEITVRTDRTVSTISDHGHPYEIKDARTYADVQWHGTTAAVRLAGLKASRL